MFYLKAFLHEDLMKNVRNSIAFVQILLHNSLSVLRLISDVNSVPFLLTRSKRLRLCKNCTVSILIIDSEYMHQTHAGTFRIDEPSPENSNLHKEWATKAVNPRYTRIRQLATDYNKNHP